MIARVCIVALCCLPAAAPAEEKLEGTWLCVRAERGGEAAKDQVGSTLVFADGKITISHPERDEMHRGTYKVDDAKTPRHLTLIPDKSENAPGSEYLGIYQINGDELTICLAGPGDERPTTLGDDPDVMRTFMVLKRDKSAR
jgi:uncharacterized protein (TIGR03067 family)